MTRRILILGEGATELRAPAEHWTGCGRVLIHRLFGSPPEALLSFEERVLSNFRRDLDFAGDEPRLRGESDQARIGRKVAALNAHGLVLLRDNDRRGRRGAIEGGLEQARALGHTVPAVIALSIECIEAWALADPDAWQRAYGRVPTLPADPESLWGRWRDAASHHPKCVLRRCFEEIGRQPKGNSVAELLEHADLDCIAARCPQGFGRFVADLRRAFPPIACAVAASPERAIGLDGEPPWGFEALRDHVDHLRRRVSTAGEGERVAVIMSRRTLRMIGLEASPQRIDLVVSRDPTPQAAAGVLRAASFDDALYQVAAHGVDRVVVLGGGELFHDAMAHFRCTELHYTRVAGEFSGCDVFFPDFEADTAWSQATDATQHHDNGFDYCIERWSRFISG